MGVEVRVVSSLHAATSIVAPRLQQPTADPFARHLVVTTHRAAEQWLSLRLSTMLGASTGRHDGVIANVDFFRPTALWRSDAEALLDGQLRARVWSELRRFNAGATLAQAARAAARLRRYCTYRPEMVDAWLAGDDVDSNGGPLDDNGMAQAALARAVLAQHDVDPAVAAHLEYASITCVALAPIPLSRLQRIESIPSHTDIVVVAVQSWPSSTSNEGNSLVHSWGSAQSSGWLAMQAASSDWVAPAQSSESSLLHRLQTAISADGPIDPVPAIDPNDVSLQIHACHGATRQVEVLRDAIAHAFNDFEGLECDDVAILCPDIDRYRPILTAVIDRLPQDLTANTPRFPLAMLQSGEWDSPFVGALIQLVELALGRCTASDIEDAVGLAPVALAFGFTDEDQRSLPGWIEASAVRWGLDGDHLRYLGLPEETARWSWSTALDRLIIGAAMDSTHTRVAIGECPPARGISFADAGGVGRLASFVSEVAHLEGWCRGVHPIAEWMPLLRSVADRCLAAPFDEPQHARRLDRVLSTIEREFAATSDIVLDAREIVQLLRDGISESGRGAALGEGRIVVGTPQQLQAIPFRVVCLLGLDHGALPDTQRDPFDLLQRDPRDGDPDPRGAAESALLSAVQAAADRLIITYDGFSVHSNQEVPPCTALAELDDVLAPLTGSDRPWRRQHPRQSFAAANFLNDGRPHSPWSFDAGAFAAVTSTSTGRSGSAAHQVAVAWAASPSVQRIVQLDDLIKALSDPPAHFLRSALGVRIPRAQDDRSDHVRLGLDNLEAWSLA